MDKRKTINIVKKYVELVNQNFSVSKIYLFGSHANGKARDESDIDVAIIINKIGDNYLETIKTLFKLRRKIDLRIEPILLELNNDPSGFLEEIQENGILIYQA